MPNTNLQPIGYLHDKYINKKLKEAELEAEKPGAKWIDARKVLKKLRIKYVGSKL